MLLLFWVVNVKTREVFEVYEKYLTTLEFFL